VSLHPSYELIALQKGRKKKSHVKESLKEKKKREKAKLPFFFGLGKGKGKGRMPVFFRQ